MVHTDQRAGVQAYVSRTFVRIEGDNVNVQEIRVRFHVQDTVAFVEADVACAIMPRDQSSETVNGHEVRRHKVSLLQLLVLTFEVFGAVMGLGCAIGVVIIRFRSALTDLT